MKNKVITSVCVILAFAAIGCFGYIFLNSNNEAPVVNNNNNNNQQQQEPVQQEVPTNREEKGQNIVVTSRIGVQLTEQIKYSELYSNSIVEEMDTNGLSSKAKILVSKKNIKCDTSATLAFSVITSFKNLISPFSS